MEKLVESKTEYREIQILDDDKNFKVGIKTWIERNIVEDGGIHCDITVFIQKDGQRLSFDADEAKKVIDAMEQILKPERI